MIRKTNRKRFWFIPLILLFGAMAYSQCNYKLVEQAAQLAGSNSVFVRDFKVRLSQASMDDPVPTGHFPIYLNKGVEYRFTIANAANVQGMANVQLLKRGQLLTSNISEDSNYIDRFDYLCERSATYQLQINFGHGMEGCAAIVMSIVLNDSITYIKPGVALQSDSLKKLYLWVDNELQASTTLGEDYIITADVSQGELTKRGNFFIIKPERRGSLDVYVTVKDPGGQFAEGDTIQYLADIPPFPEVILPGEINREISLRYFSGMGEIKLLEPLDAYENLYSLKQFRLSQYATSINEDISYNKRLTLSQIKFIAKLSPGDSFFITDIVFTGPDGKSYMAESKQVFIRD